MMQRELRKTHAILDVLPPLETKAAVRLAAADFGRNLLGEEVYARIHCDFAQARSQPRLSQRY
jgi:hypothetical protein